MKRKKLRIGAFAGSDCGVMIVHGAKDTVVPMEYGYDLYAETYENDPQFTVLRCAGCGHEICTAYYKKPDENLMRQIVRFGDGLVEQDVQKREESFMTDYQLLCEQMEALTEGVPYPVANLANASALLMQHLEDINWAGFYLMEDGGLVLGPFQGKVACVTIPVGRGVCGTAVAEDATQLVYNVHEFPGHIACDSASNSEIVVPLHVDGTVYGVLDIDSPLIGRFTESDKVGLERFAAVLERFLG